MGIRPRCGPWKVIEIRVVPRSSGGVGCSCRHMARRLTPVPCIRRKRRFRREPGQSSSPCGCDPPVPSAAVRRVRAGPPPASTGARKLSPVEAATWGADHGGFIEGRRFRLRLRSQTCDLSAHCRHGLHAEADEIGGVRCMCGLSLCYLRIVRRKSLRHILTAQHREN